ncbi:MAG TPA: hypothetical protein VIM99_17540 [Blastocatellia bacterium]
MARPKIPWMMSMKVIMRNPAPKRMRLAFAIFLAALCMFIEAQSVFAQRISGFERMNELRRLRDQLQLADPLRNSDVVMILNERVISEAARRLIGLEFVMPKGGTLKVTSIQSDWQTAAATFRIGIQAKSSVTMNLQLIGRLNSGEFDRGALRLPLKITDVKLMNGGISGFFLKTFFGEWTNPKTWDRKMPAIEVPMEIAETMRIPAGRFDVQGELPMEISTPEYHAPLKFTVTSVLALDKRAVISLRLGQEAAAKALPVSYESESESDDSSGMDGGDPAALENAAAALEDDIMRLSERLKVNGDFRAVLSRRLINELFSQMAAAHKADLEIRLKQGRIRSEEVNVIVNVKNYADVESGEGRADLTRLYIESIADGKAALRLSAQGEMDARVRGREFGVPYAISPHILFSIKDEPLPLEFASEGKKVFLRAAPGATLPIDVQFNLKIAGHELRFDRRSIAQADKWLKRVELPSFFDREIPLPRKIMMDAAGHKHVIESRNLGYALSNMRIAAKDDAIEITADVKLD